MNLLTCLFLGGSAAVSITTEDTIRAIRSADPPPKEYYPLAQNLKAAKAKQRAVEPLVT
jgi:hypothetical protein